MKTHVVLVSTKFPSTHKRKGERTYFPEKILNCQISCGLIDKSTLEKFRLSGYDFDISVFNNIDGKLHTIRGNYPLWKKRIDEVIAGDAVLSIRYHTLGRYVRGNKQIEICQLDKNSGVGVQGLVFPDKSLFNATVCGSEFPKSTWYKGINITELAKNDGLSIEDFKNWFRKYDKSEPMAIIHFTPFRY